MATTMKFVFSSDLTEFGTGVVPFGEIPRVGDKVRINNVESLDNIPVYLVVDHVIWDLSVTDSSDTHVEIRCSQAEVSDFTG